MNRVTIKARTTSDAIADMLAEEISTGTLALGAPLRQEELAARFGVSRIPIRDALQRLEGEGLVVIYPNRGAYVAELSVDEIREIIDMRVLIEGDLAFQAVRAMDEDALRAIERTAKIATSAYQATSWAEADHDFHRALYQPARKPRQTALAFSLRRAIERYGVAHARLPERRTEWIDDHRAIVEAYRARNADAARQILTRHIERAGRFIITQVMTGKS